MLVVKRLLLLSVFIAVSAISLSCTNDKINRTQAYYMLIDTSGTYTKQLTKAQQIINFVLSNLQPGDSFAVAQIDSGSFSEKDIIYKVTFDARPSQATAQKRAFRDKIAAFVDTAKGSAYTDITGGVMQAAEYLNETGAGKKNILIFSDLQEDLRKGQVRDFALNLADIQVIALNVTKLSSDNIDPRDYLKRVARWEERVVKGGGKWLMINDMERLEPILVNR